MTTEKTLRDRGIYELHLPVFKQGDDLSEHVEENPGNPAKAFRDFAARYEEAAKRCMRVAGALSELPADKVTVDAGTHYIGIQAPPGSLAGLIADEILCIPEWDEDEEELSDEEDDDEEDGS
jgi:hypothetical protein